MASHGIGRFYYDNTSKERYPPSTCGIISSIDNQTYKKALEEIKTNPKILELGNSGSPIKNYVAWDTYLTIINKKNARAIFIRGLEITLINNTAKKLHLPLLTKSLIS